MPLTMDLTGRRALVSGVTNGIGAAIARLLSQAGCDIAGCGRSAADSAGALSFLKNGILGRRMFYHVADLAQPAVATAWVQAAARDLGGIDIVVSNAGRNIFKGAATCDATAWDECMSLDLAAHWRIAQAARPFLAAARPTGVILVITSNHAQATIPGCFPYNVAKAGLVALVQSLAIEWGPSIRTVGIAPGFIDTPGNDTWFESFPNPQAERNRTEKLHPVGRLGRVDEIGALCAFLCTPWGGFISGTTLLVDGGRSALMQDS